MKLLKVLIFISFFGQSAQASLGALLSEFLKENIDLSKLEDSKVLAAYQVDLFETQNSWQFSAGVNHTDTALQNLNAFTPNQTRTTAFNAELARPFSWGGNFSVTERLIRYDLSKWNSAILGSIPPHPYENETSIKFTQDLGKNFFGQEYYQDLRVKNREAELRAIESSAQNEAMVYKFYQTFLKAQLDKSLIRLQNEALKRAKTRRSLIRKRVNDGLLPKVDFHQAEIAYLTQEENKRLAEQDFENDLKDLAGQLHRSLTRTEVNSFAFESFKRAPLVKSKLNENFDIKSLEKKLQVTEAALKKIKYSYIPTIQLSAQYNTNAVNTDRGNAFSDSIPVADNDEKVIGLSLSFPLTFGNTRVQKAMKQIEVNQSKRELKKAKQNLISFQESLMKRSKLFEANIESALKKRNHAKLALKEQNRLYRNGQTNLDRVLIAEEDLIQTERTLANYFNSYFNLAALHAQLHGKLATHLAKVVEQ